MPDDPYIIVGIHFGAGYELFHLNLKAIIVYKFHIFNNFFS